MLTLILVTCLIAAIPAAITLTIHRIGLLIWLPLLWGAIILLPATMDLTDDPAFISFAFFIGPFYLLNLPATIARILLVLADLNSEFSRGYSAED